MEPVAALAVHRLEDLVRRVQADQVEQRQRSHWVAAPEAHRGVDVLARGVVALEHRDRVVEVAEEQRVGDESRLVTGDDRRLADLLHERGDVLEHVGRGDDGADHLDQVLHRRGVEEVDADHATGVVVGGADLGDRQRRGVGRQHGLRGHDLVQPPEDVLLDVDRLHDRLHHQVGLLEVGDVSGQRDPVEERRLVLLAELAALPRARWSARGARGRGPASPRRPRPDHRKPSRENTSAMPAPMVPSPTTPIVLKSRDMRPIMPAIRGDPTVRLFTPPRA